jgi:hypothetical protein
MPDQTTPEQEDMRVQLGILGNVIAEHPTILTLRDLVLENAPETSEKATEQAVQELVALGLLHQEGSLVLPTRAALQFDKLA